MKKTDERRHTKQRALVLGAVSTADHPTAKEVYDRIVCTESISLGTVYRNLTVLAEAGEIVPVTSNPEVVRYDKRRDAHYHFCCRECGRVFDIPLPYDEALDALAHQQSDFDIERHHITFDGICADCKQ